MLDPKLGKIKIFLLLFHLLLEEVLFLVRIYCLKVPQTTITIIVYVQEFTSHDVLLKKDNAIIIKFIKFGMEVDFYTLIGGCSSFTTHGNIDVIKRKHYLTATCNWWFLQVLNTIPPTQALHDKSVLKLIFRNYQRQIKSTGPHTGYFLLMTERMLGIQSLNILLFTMVYVLQCLWFDCALELSTDDASMEDLSAFGCW